MDINGLKRLESNLPAVPGINGKEEFFNAAVLVLLALFEGEYHFIFQKRAASIRQAGEICFPGGQFDNERDLNFRDTAIRETIEEFGISREKICVLGPLDTVIAPIGVTVDAFLAVVDIRSLDEFIINPDEVERVFSVPVSYFEQTEPENYQVTVAIKPSYTNSLGEEVISFPARELGLPERYYQPWGGSRIGMFVYRADGEVIWGLTARLIFDVVRKLKNK